MRERDRGPRSEHARYAFGYSDKKPGLAWWLINGVVVLGAIASIFSVTGCQQAPRTAAERAEADRARCDAATMPETHCERLRDTSPPSAGMSPVYVDTATGCQYLGYPGHGLTPRMTKEGGNSHQMGCR